MKMGCSRCQSKETDSSGTCLACGHNASPWRQKLAQRLAEMRQKDEEVQQNLQDIVEVAALRKSMPPSSPERHTVVVSPPPPETPSPKSDARISVPAAKELVFREIDADEPPAELLVAAGNGAPDVSNGLDAAAYTPDASVAEGLVFREVDTNGPVTELLVAEYDGMPNVSGGLDVTYAIDAKGVGEERIFRETDTNEPVKDNTPDASSLADAKNITYAKNLAYAKKLAYAKNLAYARDFSYVEKNAPDHEGRLIFLSRTLSGLIDLFLVSLLSVVFLGLADYFTNAPILSSINLINFTALFLMIYFPYSIFFLTTNSQTIGMITTDLRIVGMKENRTTMSQVIRRSISFLVSLFSLVGLLIGFFNPKCLCLHDYLSGTRVIRTVDDD